MQGENKNTQNSSEYQRRYQDIVEMSLSPDNVDSYADEAMDRLSELIADIEERYKWEDLSLSDREREDRVFAEALPGASVEATLDRIDNVVQRLRRFDEMIQEVRNNPDNLVILPPDKTSDRAIVEGDGHGVQEKPIFPKLKTELFVLEQDFEVDVQDSEQLQLSVGVVKPDMQRRMSYDAIELPMLERLILSCDESGNRTYVFDTAKLEEFEITPEMIKNGTKSQLNELLVAKPEIGKSITYSPNYVERVRGAIKNPASELIPEKDKAEKAEYLKAVERAPEGWLHRNGLAKKFGVSADAINKYYDENADKIGLAVKYISAGGQPAEFFSPEQTEIFQQYFENRGEKAPEGWMTRRNLAKTLGVNVATIERYYDAHADEIGPLTMYFNAQGKQFEYFSPEQIGAFRQHFENRGEKAPEGWVTVNGLAHELGTSAQLIMDYCDTHADEIGSIAEYINNTNVAYKHFSPQQAEKVKQFFKERGEKAPEGWKTMRSMVTEYGFTPRVLRKHYREHEDEIGAPHGYFNAQGRKFEYFSPEQTAKILEYAEEAKNV